MMAGDGVILFEVHAARQRRLTTVNKASRAASRVETLDLVRADGTIDARERRFLRRLAVDFNIPAGVANQAIEAMLVTSHI
jgi:hypothetical protein